MSLPDELSSPGNRQIVRYLLGLLPDEAAERLDEASIVDDEFAARLRIGENNLIDSYVRGTLDGEELRRFESHYLASPVRRSKVRFAASFLQAVDRAAPPDRGSGDDSTPGSTTDRGAAPHSIAASNGQIPARSKLVWRLMVAAALLLLVCGVLVVQTVRLRNGLDVAQEVRLESPAPPARSALAERMTALVLEPQTRAPGPVPTVVIPAGADSVAFELRFESNDFPRYEVGLEDPASNHVVWRSDPLVPASVDQVLAVSVSIPVRVLKPQHYSLAIIGRRAGHAEVVGSYAFQVARR